jgi:MYXO-CTERM domain-containing protein
MTTRVKFLLGTVLTFSLLPLQAQAHWCGDLWGSSYNLVVRPASDTVTVPASGSANLDIFVQNNMGYALPNFVLSAKGTANIPATRQTQKVANTLLPGEKAKYTLAISKSGGGDVGIGDITFSVSFGNSGQSGLYPMSPGKAVMIRKTDGSLVPAPPPAGIGTGNDQARQLQYSAVADFSNVDTGLDKLMSFYCAGRGSWGTNDASVITTACSGTATDCTKANRSLSSGLGSKFDYTKLWAAGELAARKSALGARAATLRTRLQCGASDPNLTFSGFALMVLGYLGDDPGARTFLEGKVGTTDLGKIAKAALYLFGTANDKSKYGADVIAGLTSSTKQVAAACAAALGIVDLDDARVSSVLIPMAKWDEPDMVNDTSFLAAHLLELAAWDRRGWAAQAADKGPVTFYEGGTPVRTGGSTGSTGSTGAAGSTGTSSGGSAGSASSGSAGSIGAAGRTGTTTTPAGGSVVPTGGRTGTAVGGNTSPPVGGSASTPVGGSSSAGGNTSAPPAGGSKSSGAAGNPGTGPTVTGGVSSSSTPNAGGGNVDPGSAGEAGNNGNPGSNTAANNKSSAGGCGYAPSGQAPLGFLLAAVGLGLALRRRRK